ncbi:MAG TPA: aldehyde-activating protein, partial [Rhodobacteraceae bacterium]|nr:aldehyde-activating protein [Paracoccaceae bacterium]
MNTHKLTCHCGAIELAVKLADGLNTARRCD